MIYQCVGFKLCDGGELHVYLLINTVKTNGKTVSISRLSVNKASPRKDAKTITKKAQLKQSVSYSGV